MSSLATYHNHATTPISDVDNDDNKYDSSFIKQNESMMHKVKDVVSKLLHPSFLFSSDNDTNSPKRKRSTSTEENGDEQPTNTDAHITSTRSTTTSKYRRSGVRNDEPQLTDEEDDGNSRDVPTSTEEENRTEDEQQKKRRRTANYHNLLSTRTNDDQREDERTSSTSTFKNGVKSFSNRRIDYTTPTLFQTSTEPNHRDRTNPLTPSQQRLNVLPTYRASASNYDPSKSPLFAVRNQKPMERTTTTNFKPNDFSANHLLASGLINRPQSSPVTSQQSPATLTKPTTNTNHRLLSNERQMLGVNYASINSRRLPYIERLRRRTLQDGVRPNRRTLDDEPLSTSVIEEHHPTTTSPVANRTKPLEKDCGIQCDIPMVEKSSEPSKKSKQSYPPVDIQEEALSVPQSSYRIEAPIQTNSSITIEKLQPPIPTIEITKPKVLGDVTPFSWPRFARAQEDFATKYPEKCRANPVSTATPITTIPRIPVVQSSRPTESIWKCPCCTKEHPAQTASCSVCHGINPNYKKPSAAQSTKTVPSSRSSDVTTKETNATTTMTKAATTKENTTTIPSLMTINTSSTTFPPFGSTSITALSATTKETPTITTNTPSNITTSTSLPSSIPSLMSLTPTPVTTVKENLVTTGFRIPPILSFGPATTVTTATPVTTSTTTTFSIPPTLSFGIAPTTTTTKENPVTTSTTTGFNIPPVLSFGIAPTTTTTTTTKENPVTNSTTTGFNIPPILSFGMAPVTATTTTTTNQNPVSAAAPLSIFGATPLMTPTSVTKESPVTTSTPSSSSVSFSPFTTATTTKETTVTTPVAPFFSMATAFATSPISSPFRVSASFPTFPSTSPTTLTQAMTTSTVPSTIAMTSTAPAATSVPFGLFGSTPKATTSGASPVVTSVASNSSALFGFPPTSSTSFLPTNSTSASNPFGFSNVTPMSPVPTSPVSFPISSTTNTSPSFVIPSFSSTAPVSNISGFGSPNSSIATGSSNPTTFPSLFSTGASSSTNPNPSTLFGAASSFGTNATSIDISKTSSSSFSPFDSSKAAFGFPFGSAPNTVNVQASTATMASPGGFAFTTPTSVTPFFNAGLPTFGSSGSTNTFPSGPGISPLRSASPFPTADFSNSIIDTPNPYSVLPGSTPRHILRPKRRNRN